MTFDTGWQMDWSHSMTGIGDHEDLLESVRYVVEAALDDFLNAHALPSS